MRFSKINIRPTTSVYATYKNIKYNPWSAIAEFVDNSTQSYFDNREKLQSTKYWDGLRVEVISKRDENGEDYLQIIDNAFGMHLDDFKRAIILDSKPMYKSRSEFGMGLKTAACWFGQIWSVESVALGSGIRYRAEVDVEILRKYKNEEIVVTEEECSLKDHGTIITIRKLHRKMSGRQIGKTKDQLRGMYRSDLRSGEIKIIYNDVGLEYIDPEPLVEILPNGEEKTWWKELDFSFPFNDKMHRVHGGVGIRAKGSISEAGFALLRHGRVIIGGYEDAYRPEEIFGKSNSFPYQRVYGELNLDDWPVTQTKDAFDWYDGLEDLFIEQLKTHCSDYIKKATEYRAGTDVKATVSIESVVKAFEKAGLIQNSSVKESENTSTFIESETIQGDQVETIVTDNTTLIRAEDQKEDFNTRKIVTFISGGESYSFEMLFREDNPQRPWLFITPKGSSFEIEWNLRHPFFRNLTVDPQSLRIVEQFVFAFVLAEVKAMKSYSNNLIPPGLIRSNMNNTLMDISKQED